jgi:hypothetical protein
MANLVAAIALGLFCPRWRLRQQKNLQLTFLWVSLRVLFLLPSEKIHSCHFSSYKEANEVEATQFSSSSPREITLFPPELHKSALDVDKNWSCRYHNQLTVRWFNFISRRAPSSSPHGRIEVNTKIDMKNCKIADRNFKFPHSINQSVIEWEKTLFSVVLLALLHTPRHARDELWNSIFSHIA